MELIKVTNYGIILELYSPPLKKESPFHELLGTQKKSGPVKSDCCWDRAGYRSNAQHVNCEGNFAACHEEHIP
jgi:hypothetical protein